MARLAGMRPDTMARALSSVEQSVSTTIAAKRDALAASPPSRKTRSGAHAPKTPPMRRRSVPKAKAARAADPTTTARHPTSAPAPQSRPPSDDVQAPTIVGDPDGRLTGADAERMLASLTALPVGDPTGHQTTGPTPRVSLTGGADPRRTQRARADMQHRTVTAAHDAQRAARQPAGEHHIDTTLPATTLVASGAARATSAPPDVPGPLADDQSEILGLIAREQSGAALEAALSNARSTMADERVRHQDAERKVRADADTTIARLEAASAAQHARQKSSALQDVSALRGKWTGEIDKKTRAAHRKADATVAQGLKDVEKQRSKGEADADKAYEEGNRRAERARLDGEEKATRLKKDGEKESEGIFDWLASKAEAFFERLKNAVTRVLDAARRLARSFIERAKKFAADAIEAARRTIVGTIRLVGDGLIAIGDTLLTAFPEAQERYRTAIEDRISRATEAVNNVAEQLNKDVQNALDTLGKGLDRVLGLLETGLLAAVDLVGSTVRGALKAAQSFADGVAAFAALIKDVAADPVGWLKMLGAAIVDGIQNHLWTAFKAAVQEWFASKLMEILGIGAQIIELLEADGIDLPSIVKTAWDELKATIPEALITILIEKLVAMVVPAAGAVMAIIEGLEAAWGAVSRIIAAFAAFMRFLKLVRSGNAGPAFATALAAGAIVVIDFVANWLIKKIRKAGRAIGDRFRQRARRPRGRPRDRDRDRDKPRDKPRGESAATRRAARNAARRGWKLAKGKASRRVMREASLEQAISGVEGRKNGIKTKANVQVKGKAWTVKAIATQKGERSTATHGKGWVLRTKQGATFFAAADIRPVERRVEKMTRKALDSSAKQQAKGKGGGAQAIKGRFQSIEAKGQQMLDAKVKGLNLSLKLDTAKSKDGKTVVDALVQPNYHEWEMVFDGNGLRKIAEAVADVSGKKWLYNTGLQFLQGLADENDGVTMDFDYERYPADHREVFRHGGKSRDVRRIIAKYRRKKTNEYLNISMNAIAHPNRGVSGHNDGIAKGYGEDALTHGERDRNKPNKNGLREPANTRPHDAISDKMWRDVIRDVESKRSILPNDPVVEELIKSTGSKFSRMGQSGDFTSLATGDGRSGREIENAHGSLSAYQRFEIARRSPQNKVKKEEEEFARYYVKADDRKYVPKDDFIGRDWKDVAGEGSEEKKKGRIEQALKARIKLVMAQFRGEFLPSVTVQLLRDPTQASMQRDTKHFEELERPAAYLRRLYKLSPETELADVLEKVESGDLTMPQHPQTQAHIAKFKRQMWAVSRRPTAATQNFLKEVTDKVLVAAKAKAK